MALSKEILDTLRKQVDDLTEEEVRHMVQPTPTYAKEMFKDGNTIQSGKRKQSIFSKVQDKTN
jgi:hypothetical protein